MTLRKYFYETYKTKKSIFYFILIVFVLFCLFSCAVSKKPSVVLVIKTPIFNLKGIVDPSVKDVYSFLKLASSDFAKNYKDANVQIKITQYSNDRRLQEVAQSYGSPNAPDIIFCDNFDYVYLGNVVPLNDIITDDIKNDIDEKYFLQKTIEGKLYTMPFCMMQNVLCYNKDIFHLAGLDSFIAKDNAVASWTLQEWDNVLCTLKKNLPPDIYPMMMYAATEEGDSHIMLLSCAFGNAFLNEKGLFSLETQKGIQALQWIKQGVQKGCFPPNPQYLKMLDCYDLFINGQLAIYCANAALQSLFDEKSLSLGYVNFPSLDGTGLNTLTVQGFQVFDNKDDLKLKVAKDFVKYIYKTAWLDYSTGSIPISKRVAKKYKDDLYAVERYINNTGKSVNFSATSPNWQEVRKFFAPNIQELLDPQSTKTVMQIAKEIDAACNQALKKGKETMKLHE